MRAVGIGLGVAVLVVATGASGQQLRGGTGGGPDAGSPGTLLRGPAAAGGTAASTRRGPSWNGEGLVEAKDLVEQTVTLDGEVFRVLPQTKILDPGGRPIPLAAVPVAQERRNQLGIDVRAAASFEAVETGRGWVLERLHVRGAFPE